MMDALDMGKYGIYVWSCFGITFLVVVVMDWLGRMRHRRVFKEVEVRVKAMEEQQ